MDSTIATDEWRDRRPNFQYAVLKMELRFRQEQLMRRDHKIDGERSLDRYTRLLRLSSTIRCGATPDSAVEAPKLDHADYDTINPQNSTTNRTAVDIHGQVKIQQCAKTSTCEATGPVDSPSVKYRGFETDPVVEVAWRFIAVGDVAAAEILTLARTGHCDDTARRWREAHWIIVAQGLTKMHIGSSEHGSGSWGPATRGDIHTGPSRVAATPNRHQATTA